MTDTPETTETHTPDPDTFDIADWLTPVGEKKHRRRETVTVQRHDPALVAEIQELKDEWARRELHNKAANDDDVKADLAVGEASTVDVSDLEARGAELSERIKATSVTLTVYASLGPEIDKAGVGVKNGDPLRDYRILADAVEFPGGVKLTADQWAAFHNTIGEGQMIKIMNAWSTATYSKPEVTAPFSRRS
ncbi:hypothetical protein [Citricoccus sp. NR2]|uniref:hypothetical protein n=1 Tax=Citricoccus sp. NR2 TaxID=3004095 RepID=UPI0022DE920E|nr:hypothetical protein [Citricoccus sp. NR2]WBL18520.1 hypothetical protein O1A05_12235 [Citricoccus sp. NR2]